MAEFDVMQPDAIEIAQRDSVVRTTASYASQDFESIRERLVEYVRNHFGDDFNDFIASDYGMMILEIIAHASDMNSFKLDFLFNESFIGTARLRESLVRLAQLLGYTPRASTSARAPFSVSVPDAYDFDIVISPGQSVERNDPSGSIVRFELYAMDSRGEPDLSQNIVIKAGDLRNTQVIGVEGLTNIDRFTSTGEANQQLRINDDRLVEGWVRVEINGVAWTRVEYFTGATNEYVLTQDPSGTYVIEFGDGVNGAIPAQGSPIDVFYRSGGGKRGNIVPYFFNEVVNVPASGATVPVEIANYEAGTGGSERESTEEIRRNAVAVFKTQGRAVTATDYETLAERYFSLSGVGGVKARAALRHAGCSANVVSVYVIKSGVRGGYDYLTQEEKDAVSRWLMQRCVMTNVVRVLDAEIVQFDVTVVARTSRAYNRAAVDVEQRVRARLSAHFDISNWTIGQSVTTSGMIKAMATITDVAFVEARITPTRQRDLLPNGDLPIKYWEIAAPSSVRVQIQYES